jgi:hypothetical protein
MNFSILASRAQKLVADNAPLILTSIGVTGTVATAVLVGKASFKAADIIMREQNIIDLQEKSYPLDGRTKAALVWKEYVPAVTTGIFTIAAIICANRAGSRQAAALASAYSISETALREYKEKVLEHIGPKKEAEVREAIAQDAVKKDPPSKEIVILGGNNVLCRDGWSGRYFQSNVEDIKAAMNWINHQLNTHGAVTLTEFYSRIGLDPTEESEVVGWDTANQLDIMFEPVLTEDSRPCMSFSFRVPPSHNYNPFL